MRFWLTAAGCALAFVLAGVFFATRDSLGAADQYASVGSFLLALATLGATALIAARKREPPNPPKPASPSEPANPPEPASTPKPADAAGSRFRIGTIKDVGQLTIGDHSTTHVTHYRADAVPEKPRESPPSGPT